MTDPARFETAIGKKKTGVLVISHGSRDEKWVKLVDEAVYAVEHNASVPIVSSFLEIVEGRLIQDGIDDLEEQGVTEIIVIPLFISSGSTHLDEISWALGVIPEPTLETDLTPFRFKADIRFGAPVEDDPVIAQILLEKLQGLSRDAQKEAVLLIGHGSVEQGFHEKWNDGLARLAKRLQKQGGFGTVDSAMLLPDQAATKMQQLQENAVETAVLVAPLFISEGYFTKKVIPERLEGFSYKYNGKALLPSPLISKWMKQQIDQMLSS